MLYPKEDRVAKKLMYVCRRCDYEEEAKTPVVFKRELVKSARDELAKIPSDVIDDPSLTRSTDIVCPECDHVGGVMMQGKPLPTDEKIKLIFVCLNRDCCHKWQE